MRKDEGIISVDWNMLWESRELCVDWHFESSVLANVFTAPQQGCTCRFGHLSEAHFVVRHVLDTQYPCQAHLWVHEEFARYQQAARIELGLTANLKLPVAPTRMK